MRFGLTTIRRLFNDFENCVSRPAVALETAQVDDRILAVVAKEIGDRVRHLDVDIFALAENHFDQ
jgi:hypothetical protein